MKVILAVLLLLSLAANVGFLVGCETLHDATYGKPCRYSAQSQAGNQQMDEVKACLDKIAGSLDIRVEGKTASALAGDIKNRLDHIAYDIPEVMDDAAVEKLSVRLIGDEKTFVKEYQRFISELRGKGRKVVVVEP